MVLRIIAARLREHPRPVTGTRDEVSCGRSPRPRNPRRETPTGFAVALWLLLAFATVALAGQLPPATRTGWTVIIVNNYSPCNGPVAAGNCHGSAVITTSGAPATAPLESVTLGGSPYGAVITPDGSLALVVDILDGTLSPIDLTARPPQSLPPVHLGGRGDAFIAMTPDGRTVMVADSGAPTVYPVHVTGKTLRVGSPIDVGSPAGGIAMSPDGSTAWVVIPTKGTIRPIDVGDGSFAVGTPIHVGALPNTITVSPNGTTAYVTSTARNIVTAVPLGGGPNHTIRVGKAPEFAAITPDGSTMYVADGGSGTVTPVDLSSGTPVAHTPFAVPHGVSDAVAVPTAVAVTPDGNSYGSPTAAVSSAAPAVRQHRDRVRHTFAPAPRGDADDRDRRLRGTHRRDHTRDTRHRQRSVDAGAIAAHAWRCLPERSGGAAGCGDRRRRRDVHHLPSSDLQPHAAGELPDHRGLDRAKATEAPCSAQALWRYSRRQRAPTGRGRRAEPCPRWYVALRAARVRRGDRGGLVVGCAARSSIRRELAGRRKLHRDRLRHPRRRGDHRRAAPALLPS